jgi:hypothetical protein
LLHLSYFLRLISELHADVISDMLRSLPREKPPLYIVAVADQRTPPRFHEVDGADFTMIRPDQADSFAKRLKYALQSRGL